jgi:uncharacterized protein YjbI with pentapeptide repeats
MESNKKEQPERPPPVDIDGTATSPEEKKQLYPATGPGGPTEPTKPDPPDSPIIPGQLAPDWIYNNIQEATVNCRKLLFIYLVLLSYGTLSALTTPVENLFLGQSIEMPIIKATIPLYYFLIITPLLAIGFFVYNQLHLRKINRLIEYAIKECQAIHPNCDHINPAVQQCNLNDICRHHENRLYPWIFIFSRYSRVKTVRKFQHAFIWCSLWFFLPATLVTFTLFVLKKHDHLLFYLMLSMTVAGIAVVFFFWNFQQNPVNPFRFMVSEQKAQSSYFLIFILLFSAFFIGLHIQAREGRLWWVKDSVWETDVKLHNKILRSMIFVNLEDRQLVAGISDEQDHSLILKNTHFEGANLSFANLKKVNLRDAHIQNANLIDTKLVNADLSGANLKGANLSGSKLNNAKFKGADLKNSDLVMADLTKADFSYADMGNSDLRHADLKETDLTSTIVSFADFRGALNINYDRIKKTEDWQIAFFSKDLLKKLGLPKEHNQNLEKRKIAGYNLSGIDFLHTDFSGFNFTGCDLTAVSFNTKTDLRGVSFKDAKLKWAILMETNLSKANLIGADLSMSYMAGARLRGTNITNTVFKMADIQSVDFRGARGLSIDAIKEARNYRLAYYDEEFLNQLGLPPAHNDKLKRRDFSREDFREQKLNGSNFSNFILTSANFQKAILEGANFHSARLKHADFSGSNLSRAKFSEADLKDCNIEGAKLLWADFRSAKNLMVRQVKTAMGYQLAMYDDGLLRLLKLPQQHNDRIEKKYLYGYNLRKAWMAEFELVGVDLSNAVLVDANLTDAVLYRANLGKANLSMANLTNADLTDADLQYADLSKAKGLNIDQLSQAANSKLAYYSDDWLWRLGLPLDHNERLKNKDLHGYEVQQE